MSDKYTERIQHHSINILREIDRICRANDIPYFITNGTLLGAVRHKGFIPWDDDIDVAKPTRSARANCRR